MQLLIKICKEKIGLIAIRESPFIRKNLPKEVQIARFEQNELTTLYLKKCIFIFKILI